jgi:hypothetical protein
MSDTEREPDKVEEGKEDESSRGPSLTLIYSLVALAFAAAIGFALLIVMPFYHRR